MTVRSSFLPIRGAGLPITAAAATPSNGTVGFGSKSLQVTNLGANIMYVCTYNSKNTSPAPTATTADDPIFPGTKEVIGKAQDDDSIAWVSALGTTAQALPGEGQ